MKAKSLSPDEKLLNLIVSSSDVACAYAYISSFADINFLFALAGCVGKKSNGQ